MQCRSASPRIIARLCNASAVLRLAPLFCAIADLRTPLPPPCDSVNCHAMPQRCQSSPCLRVALLCFAHACLCHALPVLRSSSPSYAVASPCCGCLCRCFSELCVTVQCRCPAVRRFAEALLRVADHRQIHSVMSYAVAVIGHSELSRCWSVLCHALPVPRTASLCRCSVTPCPASPVLNRPRPPSRSEAPS